MKTACVLGGGGFIGNHLVSRLKQEGYWVKAVDLKYPEFSKSDADEFVIGDLRNENIVSKHLYNIHGKRPFDMVFQLAADMGGAGYIFSKLNDADVMHNSALINLHVAKWASTHKVGKVFFSSSACAYPEDKQLDPNNLGLKEADAIPANPDSCYGWEKIFSEFLYDAFYRNYNLDVRIARFHNIFGEYSTYNNGKEKAPAALCRKVAEVENGGVIEIWGSGWQTRSFLYIDECIDGILKLMDSDYIKPINIGSDEIISINELAKMVIDISHKVVFIKNIESNAVGVQGRNSDNTLIKEVLGWSPTQPLKVGMEKLYKWVNSQVNP